MRLTRAEEAGHPDTVGMVVVGVGIQEMLQPFGNFVSEYVFAQLVVQAGLVVSFDDAFDRSADGVFENAIEFHCLLPYT
ncbi:hypothetical protein D3C84_815150 [compost metagenome]